MRLFLSTLALCLTLSLGASAQRTGNTIKDDTYSAAELNDAALTSRLARCRQQKDYLSGMYYATLLLSRNENNSNAKQYIHNNWDKMVQQWQTVIDSNNLQDDIDCTEQRCKAHKQMAAIEDNLRGVKMPLHGQNDKWVWQPEMLYVEGIYQSERRHLATLLRQQATLSIKNYDSETLGECYQRILDSDLLLEQEKAGNLDIILADCNKTIKAKSERQSLADLLFVSELCNLSLKLNANQSDIETIRSATRQKIYERYLVLAHEAQTLGDTIKAQELTSAAQEYK